MNLVLTLQSQLLKALGMSIIHSIWEGALVLLPVLLLLALISKEKAVLRYMVLYTGLMTMLVLFVFTFLHIHLADPVQEAAGAAGVTGRSTGLLSPDRPSLPPGSGLPGISMIAHVLLFLDTCAPLLALIWIAGFMVTGIRLATLLYSSQAFVSRRTIEPDRSLLEVFDKVRRLMEIEISIRLRMSVKKISPMVTGYIKPVIIIPIAALANLSPSQVEAILAHELAHIKRYDHLLLLLQEVAKVILFFHPLTWYFTAAINREREHGCDDLVLETFSDPINYIKALTMVQEMNLAGWNTANAVLNKPARLLNRVRRLIQPQTQTFPLMRLVSVFALLLSAGILLATTFKKAEYSTKNDGPSSLPVGFPALLNPPDDSILVEVQVNTDTDKKQQDTIYAAAVPSIRTVLIKTGDRSKIIPTDSINHDAGIIRKEIRIIVDGDPPTDVEVEADYNQQPEILNLYNFYQPDTGLYGKAIRQQYLEQLRNAQEEAMLSLEEMKRIQEETARRLAEQAREQVARAGEMIELAREQMESSRAELEDARGLMMEELKEDLKSIQEEMMQKQEEMQKEIFQNQQEMQELLRELNSTLRDLEN